MYHLTSLLEDAICKSRNYRQTIPYAQVKRIFNFKLKTKWMKSSGVTKIRFCALKIVALIKLSFHRTGLKKLFVCRHPTLGLRVESVGRVFFLFWWKLVSFPGPYRFSKQAFSQEKVPLSATIVVIDIDKAQVNQRNEGIQSNYTFLFYINNRVAKGLTLKMV